MRIRGRVYVLADGEGEALMRPTSKVEAGAGIPVHRHDTSDEVLFLHEGSAVAAPGSPPGSPVKPITPTQVGEIGRKHGTSFGPQ
jgi:hypothetical protein